MKRVHFAILTGEILSYALIVTFIFADTKFNLTGIFREFDSHIDPQAAFTGACLVALVGTINVWLTWYYMRKSATVRDWLVICAWTHRVRSNGRWISLEEFLTEHLGFEVSHGLSDAKFMEMRNEIDSRWRRIDAERNVNTEPGQAEEKDGTVDEGSGRHSTAG